MQPTASSFSLSRTLMLCWLFVSVLFILLFKKTSLHVRMCILTARECTYVEGEKARLVSGGPVALPPRGLPCISDSASPSHALSTLLIRESTGGCRRIQWPQMLQPLTWTLSCSKGSRQHLEFCTLSLRLLVCVVDWVPPPPLSLQFHHVPLYLEWAPVGIFSSPAPQKKEPRDAPAEPAGKDRMEPETG